MCVITIFFLLEKMCSQKTNSHSNFWLVDIYTPHETVPILSRTVMNTFEIMIVLPFLKKLDLALPYDPEISLLGLYPEELKTGTETNTCM